MKIYKPLNVLQEAENRIERLFNDFENVIVGFSGGKDSTVILNISLKIARKLNRLPLKVMWIDQEAEWESTVNYVEDTFKNPDIDPIWFQMQMKWNNNLSNQSKHLIIWEEGKQWIREKSPVSIKENKYLDFGFNELFDKIMKIDYKGIKSCFLSGVRTQEAPKRLMALTGSLTYKEITWGKVLTPNMHYTFYPIYDWAIKDVWKYIHDNNFEYNKIYDEMYRHGVNINNMRVSSLHHETSLQNLLLVQEIEPNTWNKISGRVAGSNAIKHLKSDAYKCPKKLPYMFEDWEKYAFYLAENIIKEDKYKKKLYKQIEKLRKFIINDKIKTDLYRIIINTILIGDWDFTKLLNFTTNPYFNTVKKYVNGQINKDNIKVNRKYDKYIKGLI